MLMVGVTVAGEALAIIMILAGKAALVAKEGQVRTVELSVAEVEGAEAMVVLAVKEILMVALLEAPEMKPMEDMAVMEILSGAEESAAWGVLVMEEVVVAEDALTII